MISGFLSQSNFLFWVQFRFELNMADDKKDENLPTNEAEVKEGYLKFMRGLGISWGKLSNLMIILGTRFWQEKEEEEGQGRSLQGR